MNIPYWLNTAWRLKCLPEARAFERATHRVSQTQEALLLSLLHRNRDTDFGRAHGFADIRRVEQFQERVPIRTYDDFSADIQRIAAGEKNVLTADPVTLLEPTSGTTRGEKWIPYTASLRREFQRAIAVWVADVFGQRPQLRQGRAYWSLSPAVGGTRHSAGGVPIGFEDDAAYLGGLEQWALTHLRVVPPGVVRVSSMETFRYATLLHLLRADDLTLISIWSPTFLTVLMAGLSSWRERLIADVRDGDFRPPQPVSEELRRSLRPVRPSPARAQEIANHLSHDEPPRSLWPRLELISCWADGGASAFVPALGALFPDVEIQPKGLMATESCVSIPLLGRAAPALAIRSHFFELQETSGRCCLVDQVETGGRYRVVLTTGGGLYRYPLGDEVDVIGREGQCPLVQFVGRSDHRSDLVGEKLAEPHVRAVLERIWAEWDRRPAFAMVVPVMESPPRYRLYVQMDDPRPARARLVDKLDAGLRENPYYRHAVDLGQLAAAEVAFLDPAAEPGWAIFERHYLSRGRKSGSIKPCTLACETDLSEAFQSRAI